MLTVGTLNERSPGTPVDGDPSEETDLVTGDRLIIGRRWGQRTLVTAPCADDQLTEQLNKVVGQVQHLPRYQVDWSALREIMRDLTKEFQKLRRITGKCLPLVSNEEHKRIVRDLAEHIDQKIESCRSMGG